MAEHTTSFAQNLSAEDLDYLKQIARKTCARVASASRMDAGASIRWEPLGCKDGVDLYIGAIPDQRVRSKSRKYMCGVTYIMATIDEVVQLFHSKASLQRTKSQQPETRFNAFERDILNTRTLYKIRKRTSANPRHAISLKWMRLGSSAAEMEDRDFVYLECQDTIFDEKLKRRGWVCSMHSVHLPSCPVLDGYVRGSLYRSGYVVRETSTPGTLELVCIMDMDFKGVLSDPASNLWLKARVLTVSGVRQHFENEWNQQIPTQAPPIESPVVSTATNCAVCIDEFNKYNPSTTCINCQQAVCGSCSCEVNDGTDVWCTTCLIAMKNNEKAQEEPEQVDILEETENHIEDFIIPSPQAPSSPNNEEEEDSPGIDNEPLDENQEATEEEPSSRQASIASDEFESIVGVVQTAGFFGMNWGEKPATVTWSCDSEHDTLQETINAINVPIKSSADPMCSLAITRLKRAKTLSEQQTRLAIVQAKDSPIVWTHNGTADNLVQIFTGEEKVTSDLPPLMYMSGHTQIHTTLNTLTRTFLQLPSHNEFRHYIEDEIVINSHTLLDIQKPKPKQPVSSTSINWMAIQSVSALMQSRDFLYVQYQDQVDGPQRGWISCMHSVNLESCPPLNERQSLVRGGIYSSGFFFKETTRPGVLDATFILQVDFKGKAPRLLCTSTLKQWISTLGRIALYFARPRHFARPSLDREYRKSESCSVCNQALNGFRVEKETCRKCQDVICSKCAVWSEVELEVVGIIKVLVCTICAVKEQHRLQMLLDSVASTMTPPPPPRGSSQGHSVSESMYDVSVKDTPIEPSSPKGMIPLRYSISRQSYLEPEGHSSDRSSERPSLPARLIAKDFQLKSTAERRHQSESSAFAPSPSKVQTPRSLLNQFQWATAFPIALRSSAPALSACKPIELTDSTRCVYEDPSATLKPVGFEPQGTSSKAPSMVQVFSLSGDGEGTPIRSCIL
ncbi:hypothetical protein THRCLA_06516 [Thraustotheca clavata]|uniref:START domain-containing protein n=1 Tax=Thraustotheca clavata TaxID=74557 RepID=A0A1V9ZN59_9STRA|nr:hypothetical protein THRCLA_06516 [Thraustotheca clavata]